MECPTPGLGAVSLLSFIKFASTDTTIAKSSDRVDKSVDTAMNKETPSNGHVEPGVSLRNGPVQDTEMQDAPTAAQTNGVHSKRKAFTGKSYKPESDSEEDDVPLVSTAAKLRGGLLTIS